VWTLSPGVPIGCRLPRKRGPYSTPKHNMPKDCVRMFFVRDELVVPSGWQAEVRDASEASWRAITKLTFWALGPPLFILAVGAALTWAFAGFKLASKP